METPFIGLDNLYETANVDSFQLYPVYDHTISINYSGNGTLLPLSNYYNHFGSIVYSLVYELDSVSAFTFTVGKGAAPNEEELFTITFDGTDSTVVKHKSYVNDVAVYVNDTTLYIVAKYSPSIYIAETPDDIYISADAAGTLVKESLFLNGYFSSFIQALAQGPKRVLDKCRPPDVGDIYAWNAPTFVLYIWSTWGDTNITFDYLRGYSPTLTMNDLL